MNVRELLWPARRPKLEGIEAIAERIAAGDPPAATEIVAVLDAARCSDADLQKAVDRHVRVRELRQTIAAAAPSLKRLDAIQAELDAADAAVRKAEAARQAVTDRVGQEYVELKFRASAAATAEGRLMERDNLPPDHADRIAAAQAAADAATERESAARSSVDSCRRSLKAAEEQLPQAEDAARVGWNTPDIVKDAERWRNAVKARGERLRDAEAEMKAAAADAAATSRALAEAVTAAQKAVIG